ncbi:hypothetical protein UFOVP37_64 [uncultured Caudovirales phage]|uniref:Uncharacterized protein n=1 Tax=uncultured Caudovirales phage TaxID=2100421 RepID=A0A6J5KNJ1_9CAUD|nr:hypothetical protein UFOVP37_64 [uncultured Caudovirales phage]
MSANEPMDPFFTTMKIRACEGNAAGQVLLEAYGKQQVQAAMAQIAPRIQAAIEQSALDAAVAERQRIIEWMRNDDGAGMTAKEYADVLAMGIPTENTTETPQ